MHLVFTPQTPTPCPYLKTACTVHCAFVYYAECAQFVSVPHCEVYSVMSLWANPGSATAVDQCVIGSWYIYECKYWSFKDKAQRGPKTIAAPL